MEPVNFPQQTPLYYALHAERYQRRELIRQVQALTGRKLMVYFTNAMRPDSAIDQRDVVPFQEMIYDCLNHSESDVDLLIQSSGGDIDAAEKIVSLIRGQVASLRVIVSERAKSAATLIALAADEILMSDTSELGPIDPQVVVQTATGQPVMRPAQSFLDGLKRILQETQQAGVLNPAYYPILSHLDPALIDFCEKAIARSKQFARRWLEQHMCAGDVQKAESIARQLCDVERYASHGAVINYEEAQAMGLKVNYVRTNEPLWEAIWRLHTAYEVFIHRTQLPKVFETEHVSIA
ncbi:Serine dehydrogenase proteinase [Armatimonadetes bacterium GBS]|jgi:hypothetical protein|nr:Serine dehydrogenase proteinase [Armatimonadetes bacterium GBS]CUU34677.1 Serine dehydrogenase proteinase [Armatimonadetes bacterium GXS]